MSPHAPRPKPPLEKAVQRDVATVAALYGFEVIDLSQGYRSPVCRKCGAFLGRGAASTRQTVGLPDLYLQHRRLPLRVWVEVKRPGERPSPDQTAWHERERRAGGTVLVVHSGHELHQALEPLVHPSARDVPVVRP